MTRYKSLDILRGLAAFSIMIYHFSIWSNQGKAFTADSFWGRIGLYGVSIFYVLSGLTMYLVYQNKMTTIDSVKSFFTKRIFRIFPLYWLACLGSVLLLKTKADSWAIFWNFSGLFAFFNKNSLTTGGWSIGNELVFYAFFPLLIWVLTKGKKIFITFFIISILIGLFFCFFVLNTTQTMMVQWINYINPFNQLYFFIAGIWLGTIQSYSPIIKQNQGIIICILLIMSALFVFAPIQGSQTALISGINRIIFSVLSIGICFCFFVLEIKLLPFIEKVLCKLGEISYGVYLIHPICFLKLREVLIAYFIISTEMYFTIAIIFTILLSYIIYSWIEKPMIRLGKYLTK
jgi:exopolysaccharide production protein ExoZ